MFEVSSYGVKVHLQGRVENIITIYPDGSEFSRQFSIVHFYRQNTDVKLLRPLNFHGSASFLYKQLYRPLFFSNVLDLILFGSNKGYRSCSPCHHFHSRTHVKKLASVIYEFESFSSQACLLPGLYLSAKSFSFEPFLVFRLV
jgi:hypothetical protein